MNPRWLKLLAAAFLVVSLPACFWRKATEAELQSAPKDNAPAAQPTVAQPDPTPMNTLAGYGWDGTQVVYGIKARFDYVAQAAQAAMRKFDFELDSDATRRGQDNALIVGVNVDKRRLEIKLKQMTGKTAEEGQYVETKVKVGVTGDRGAAERVLDEIQRQLGNRGKN